MVPWDTLVLQTKTQLGFQDEINRAKAIFRGESKRDYVPGSFSQLKQTGHRVEKQWDFIALDDFRSTHQCLPSDLGLAVDTVEVETGKAVQGVVLPVASFRRGEEPEIKAFLLSWLDFCPQDLQDCTPRHEELLGQTKSCA